MMTRRPTIAWHDRITSAGLSPTYEDASDPLTDIFRRTFVVINDD